MQVFLLCCCALAISLPVTTGTKGVDVSQYVSYNAFRCLRRRGYRFAIVRAFRSNGRPDYNAVRNIRNARRAGFRYVDVYMFPRYKSRNAWRQVAYMLRNLKRVDRLYGMIWLDIEGRRYWSSNRKYNLYFIKQLYNAVRKQTRRHRVAFYSSRNNWRLLTGNTKYFASKAQIWYAHYDRRASFRDWYRGHSFGGWRRPSIKQYQGDVRECGVMIDRNFY